MRVFLPKDGSDDLSVYSVKDEIAVKLKDRPSKDKCRKIENEEIDAELAQLQANVAAKKTTMENTITENPKDNSLISCHAIITAGGFETPAEAMYLNKKLLSIPILNHFEQECNAAALNKMGVKVLKKLDQHFAEHFKNWINQDNSVKISLTHSTKDIVEVLMNNPSAKTQNT